MNTAILNGLLSSAKLLPRCYGVSGLHVSNIIAPIAHSWLSLQHLTRFVQHHLSTSCIPSSLRSFQSWPLNKHCRLSTSENSFAAQHSSPKSPRSVEKYDCSCREFFGGWKTTAGLNLDPGPCRGNVPSFWKGSCFQGGKLLQSVCGSNWPNCMYDGNVWETTGHSLVAVCSTFIKSDVRTESRSFLVRRGLLSKIFHNKQNHKVERRLWSPRLS